MEIKREEDGSDEKKMPLLDHLIELRQRLIYAVVGLIAVFFACFFIADDLFKFLRQPLEDVWRANGVLEQQRWIFITLQEKFFTDVKIAFFAALFLAFPLLASQLWLFVAPGLYRHEKRAFFPFLVATPVLFFLGGAFVYYIVMPVAWDFFYTYGVDPGSADTARTDFEARVADYLSLSMRLIFAFGLSFELPVFLTLLARVGMVTSAGLKQKRRYAIVLAFVAAAILTPPDPISQIGLALPIIFLYEISILSARLIERGRGEDGVADDDWDDDEDDEEAEEDDDEPNQIGGSDSDADDDDTDPGNDSEAEDDSGEKPS